MKKARIDQHAQSQVSEPIVWDGTLQPQPQQDNLPALEEMPEKRQLTPSEELDVLGLIDRERQRRFILAQRLSLLLVATYIVLVSGTLFGKMLGIDAPLLQLLVDIATKQILPALAIIVMFYFNRPKSI